MEHDTCVTIYEAAGAGVGALLTRHPQAAAAVASVVGHIAGETFCADDPPPPPPPPPPAKPLVLPLPPSPNGPAPGDPKKQPPGGNPAKGGMGGAGDKISPIILDLDGDGDGIEPPGESDKT